MRPELAAPVFAALLKVTLLLGIAMVLLHALRRASAAIRHAVCVLALLGTVLVAILSFLPRSYAVALDLPLLSVSTSYAGNAVASVWPATWMVVAAAIWLGGAIVFFARYAAGIFFVRRVVAGATPVRNGSWQADLGAFSHALGLRGSASLLAADIGSPLSCGLLKPVILVPRGAVEWQCSHRRAVLLHELAHIQRRDLWMNAMAAGVCVLFWFHPLVWMLMRRMRSEQEFACDDAVLNQGVVPSSYAELLLESAGLDSPGPLLACAMTGYGGFKSRLVHVLDGACCRRTRRAVLARSCGALGVAVLGIGLLHPAPAEEVHNMGGDVKAPKLISKVEPKYTEEARDAKIQGKVVVEVVVGTDGRIHNPKIVERLDPGLDANAIIALEQWLFRPGAKKDEPVAVRARVEINFRLQ